MIQNKIIPWKGFRCINLFGVLFVRNRANIDYGTINHERIHTEQMKDLLYIGFYLIYVLEWVYNCFKYGSTKTAYKMISFEVEAYEHENEIMYIDERKWCAQWRNNQYKD
jgi:hypothetical protein